MRGNTGSGPMKVVDEDGLAEGNQRWRFIPLHKRLANTSARPAALPSTDYNLNLDGIAADDTSFSHFSATLAAQAEENITATFVQYIEAVKPLSLSLPLVYRNRAKIVDISLQNLVRSVQFSGESIKSVAACLAALSKDLGSELFHPLFPRVVTAIAYVLDASSRVSTPADHDEKPDHSLFWQPEIALIPLFATLSEISKALLSSLATNPSETLTSLLPLLAHSHYRVREMTAEACLGYLVRKTRDRALRHDLVETIVDFAAGKLEGETILSDLVDGLGVALFEGVSLPSGQLHSRAKDVLCVALSRLMHYDHSESEAESDTIGPAVDDLRLAVVARCFANLCHRVYVNTDVQKLGNILLSECDSAASASDYNHIANVLFLFRKWIQFGGKSVLFTLDMVFCQRLINFVVSALEQGVNDERLVFEAFGLLCNIHQYSTKTFRENSVTRAFSTALEILSKGTNQPALLTSLRVLLDGRYGELTPVCVRALANGVASVCNQVAKVHVNGADCTTGKDSVTTTSSLQLALKFLRFVTGGTEHANDHVHFHAPALESQVVALLRSHTDLEIDSPSHADGMVSSGVEADALEYLSFVRVTQSAPLLQHLLTVRREWDFDYSASFLAACACQLDKENPSENDEFGTCARDTINRHLLTDANAWRSVRVCLSAIQYVRAFHCGLVQDVQENDDSSKLSLHALKRALVENISGSDPVLRRSSAILLMICDPPSSGKLSGVISEAGPSDDVQENIQMLRNVLLLPKPPLHGLCRPLLSVFQVTRSLDGISSGVLMIQELVRIVGQLKGPDVDILFLLTHFSLGLFQVPLKALWRPAGELFISLCAHDSKLVMTAGLSHFKKCETTMLSEEIISHHEAVAGKESEVDSRNDPRMSMLRSSREGNEDGDVLEVGSAAGTKLFPGKRGTKRKSGNTSSFVVSKRQRTKSREAVRLHWDSSEWRLQNDSSKLELYSSSQLKSIVDGCTNSLTCAVELLRTFAMEPKYTLKFRPDLISLYLKLRPSLFSRTRGNLLGLNFTSLLEKMGGLKCCEINKEMEARMRERLLSDIARNAVPLQSSALLCLCVSRSPSVKPYRDSFIRLISDRSFREELTLMTETQFSEWNMSEDAVFSQDQEAVIDVLIRICFSKMIGGKGNVESRKSAVLSFITSKLPWNISLAKITTLLLEPIKKSVESLEESSEDDYVPNHDMPDVSVQRGLLSSIESVVKHCRRTLPAQHWRKIAFAVLLLLQKAGSGSGGQNARARALRLLSDMHEFRPNDTAFLTIRVLAAVKETAFGSGGATGTNGAPALLSFLGALYKTSPLVTLDAVFAKHRWTVLFCVQVLNSPRSNENSVELTTDIISRFLAYAKEGRACNDSTVLLSIVENIAKSMNELLVRMMSAMYGNRSVQRKWSKAFALSLDVVKILLTVSPSSAGLFTSLADELSSFLQKMTSPIIPPSSILTTLASIFCAVSGLEKSSSAGSAVRVAQLLPLLSARRFVNDNESHNALCDLIVTVGSEDFLVVVQILKNLNAMNLSRIGEPDLDRRIEALNIIISSFKDGLGGSDNGSQLETCDVYVAKQSSSGEQRVMLSADAVIALYHGCLSSIYSSDSAIRGTAGYSLKLIARWSSLSTSDCAVSSRLTVFKVLFKSFISSKRLVHRREACSSFGEFVRCCTELPHDDDDDEDDAPLLFSLLKGLCSIKDPDADFFENLVHLQPHRRSRSLRQLQKHIDAISSFEDASTFSSKFVLPLGMQIATERPDLDELKKGRNPKNFMSKEDAQRDVSVWAVDCVGSGASKLDWVEYKNCLDGLLKKISFKEEEDEALVLYKMLVKVSEAFPKREEGRYPEGTVATDFLVDRLLPKMLPHVSCGAVSDELMHHNEKSATRFVQVGGRKEKPQTSFRAPVAIALGQLMSQLPIENLETLMPLLVTPLTTALRSRATSVRDSAKRALTSVTLVLGSKYMPYVLHQVFSVLDEGFRKEMCIYVIHSLLQGIREFSKKSIHNGEVAFAIDNSVDLIVSQILTELKDGASERRKDFEDPNASDVRMKRSSARAMKAYECAELLGELVTFKQSATVLCMPLLQSLSRTGSSKLIGRLAELMQRLLIGLSKNSSLVAEEAFKFCHELIYADEDGSHVPIPVPVKQISKKKKKVPLLLPKIKQFRSSNFALQLLNVVLGKNVNVLNDGSTYARQLLSMCEPYLLLAIAALKTGQDVLTLTSFRVLQKLLKLPLSGRESVADEISSVIVDVLSNNSGGVSGMGQSSDLFNTCLRAGAVLLKEVGRDDFTTVSRERVDALLAIACDCVENGSSECRSAAVALLRAVVSSKVVLPSVYDTMEKVNRLAIHAQSSSLRTACISVSIMFLVTFPLGQRRIRQHLEFFVRNINYELPSGRVAALQAIRELIMKFPEEVLEKESEYLFVALTANVARDDEGQCRNLAFDCVKSLFERLPAGRCLVDLLRIGAALIGVECSMTSIEEPPSILAISDSDVRQSGAASLAAACKSGRLSALQLKLVGWSLVVALEAMSEEESWESIYGLLHCVEALFEAQPSDVLSSDMLEKQAFMQGLWERITLLLLHRNQWIRLVAARLVGSHLSAWGGRKGSPSVETMEGLFCVWDHNEHVREWIKALCLQLEADQLAMELGHQCLKNVLCMSDVIQQNPMVGDIGKDIQDQAEEGGDDVIVDADAEEDIENRKEGGRSLRWLLGRVSGMALKGGTEEHDLLRRACALRFLLVTAKWWGKDVVSDYKQRYIWPIVKVLESGETMPGKSRNDRFRGRDRRNRKRFDGADDGDAGNDSRNVEQDDGAVGLGALKSIAESLQVLVLECVGQEVYYQTYRELQTKRTAAKLDRKRKMALLTAIDPERMAKRKRMKVKMRKVKRQSSKIGRTRGASAQSDMDVVDTQREKQRLTEDM